MPVTQLDNLKRWIASEHPGQWVDEHGGRWNHSDWLALMLQLQEGAYWPMVADDVGAHLELLATKYRQERDELVKPTVTSEAVDEAFRWYVAGLSLVGLASGYFAGASHTPIVGTLLPLLFALIGGTSGFYIANADLSSPALRARLRWLGISLLGFGFACLVGSTIGIGLRLHFEQAFHGDEIGRLWGGRPQEQIQLVVLRTKLRLLGVSHDEEATILTSASKALKLASEPITPDHLRTVAARARQLESELRKLKSDSSAPAGDAPEHADALIAELNQFSHQTEPWVQTGMPRELYKTSVETVYFQLSRIAMPRSDEEAAWIQRTGFDTKNLYAFFEAIHEEFMLRDDLGWQMGSDTSKELDKFLQWASKPAPRSSEVDEFMPAIDPNGKATPTEEKKNGDPSK